MLQAHGSAEEHRTPLTLWSQGSQREHREPRVPAARHSTQRRFRGAAAEVGAAVHVQRAEPARTRNGTHRSAKITGVSTLSTRRCMPRQHPCWTHADANSCSLGRGGEQRGNDSAVHLAGSGRKAPELQAAQRADAQRLHKERLQLRPLPARLVRLLG